MRRLLCIFGVHAWRVSRFVALGTPPGEYDVFCDRCGKCESRRDTKRGRK